MARGAVAGSLGLSKPRLKIFFDGGCRPNPGRMEAAVVARGVTHLFPDLGHGTNNDAEWLALIAALRVAQDLGVADFVLLGDAATVIHQATGAWKCRSPALQAQFIAMGGVRPVQIRKVARSQNLAGIALAKAAASPSRAGPPPVSALTSAPR